VLADPLFDQVFHYLFDNALCHGETVNEITVSLQQTGPSGLLLVENNGISIPAADKNKISERGYGKETGWGLFLARELLAATGMTITETGEQEKGHGSRSACTPGSSVLTVRIFLPREVTCRLFHSHNNRITFLHVSPQFPQIVRAEGFCSPTAYSSVMREIIRQAIHLCFGLGIAILVFFIDHGIVIAVMAGGLLIGVVFVDLLLRGYTVPVLSPLVQYGDRCDPLPGKGAFFFAVSALACIILFPVSIVVPALISLAVLDSVTTLAGMRFGRHRFYNGKSWEGTLYGVVITVLALVPFLSLSGALLAAIIAGIIELFSPIDDNLMIPVGICIFLTLVPVLV
jgi:phytol kinase